MKSFIIRLREGYYFFQLKLNGQAYAYAKTLHSFKYLFLGYYFAIIMVLVGLAAKVHPIHIEKNSLLSLLVGGLIMYTYKLLVDRLFGDVLAAELNTVRNEATSKNIRLLLSVFLLSFVAMGLAMLLLVVVLN